MRIGVNLLSLTNDRFGGVEQYVTHLISQLLTMDKNIKLFLFLTRPCRDLFPDYQDRLKKLMIKEYKVHDSIYPLIAECQLDLWFSPIHKSYIPNVPVPSIATIHDVLHTAYPQFVQGELIENNRYYQHFAPSFDAVLTVSEFSRNAIAKNLHIPKEKIYAVYQDAPMVFRNFPTDVLKEKIMKKYSLEEGYAIYPSSYNPHKNHISLLKALVVLRDTFKKRIPLVLTGYASSDNRVYQSVLDFLQENELKEQVNILGYVPREDMPSLYSNASFMIFPSLYEGFGIPLVEAMKAQCPIVCSDRGSIPEIAGHAAIKFNPEDPEDIALKVLKISGPEIRKKMIIQGIERSKIFSWENCAKETLNVFRRVVKRNEKR
ncbi:glycosyltransferase family 1 protein [Fictibacillus sp. UD]|uniref:glycosyltransferase family 4 protein n=1 Tax=Fictibacillus sp. UD TaxID=3038777 RepID=UPI0037468F97